MADNLIHFRRSEFACTCKKCGKGFDDMYFPFLVRLDQAREAAGVPFPIISSIRCEARNTAVGGVSHSSHITGHAVDIAASESGPRFAIVRGLLAAGFTRIGIGKYFIHVDCDPNKVSRVIWTY